MTDTLKLAAEALRPFADAVFNDNGDVTLDTSRINTREYLGAKKALAAIEAELARVPEDREKLASKFDGGGYVLGNVSCAEVATFLRSPVSGGAEEMRERAALAVDERAAKWKAEQSHNGASKYQHSIESDGHCQMCATLERLEFESRALAAAIRALPAP